MGGKAGDILARQQRWCPTAAGDAPGQKADEGGLARAVGADQGMDLALVQVEIDAVHGAQAAEMRVRSRVSIRAAISAHLSRIVPRMPLGAKSTSATSAVPTEQDPLQQAEVRPTR
jgi:hypothetical protein